MTRMEKFAAYREQILNQDRFLISIEEQSNQVKEYKEKIDKISPNILENTYSILKILPLTSVDKVDKTKFNGIKKFVKLVDMEKNKQASKEISQFLYSYKNNSIIDTEANEISLDWLNKDENFVNLEKTSKKLKKAQDNVLKYKEISSQKLKKLNEAIVNSEKSQDSDYHQYEVKLDNVQPKSRAFKKIYFFAIGALVLSMILSVIFIVLKVTIWK